MNLPEQIKEYHAHIYWKNPEERERAYYMRGDLIEMKCLVGIMHEQPIGPHTLPQFQVRYNEKNRYFVEVFLKMKANKMTVLLHESINDDLLDHTQGARWLGQPVELNLAWFQQDNKRSSRRKY